MGKKSRTKGHSFEREIARKLGGGVGPFPHARRHLEYQDSECYGVDLVNTGPYRIQCKRGKKPAPLSALLEVRADEMLGEVPILVTQGDRGRIIVAMPFEEFLRLLKGQVS